MDSVQKAPIARFRFLDEEQFRALSAREKLAYLAAAIGELQRLSDESLPHAAGGADTRAN